ncbi:MAG: aldehyde dehydrogenase family protein [Protaetiibacter sp.]
MTDALDATALISEEAARRWSAVSPTERASALLAAADALDAARADLIEIAREETGLSDARLGGELTRTIVQARLFADVVQRAAFLDVRIDSRDTEFVLGVRPELRRYRVPLGPVLNFAASNFPFAFSVFGGDTVSAIAAGCPVIVKLHSGHPRLGERTTEVVSAAFDAAGAPPGLIQAISGQENGVAMLRNPRIRAAAFTGSTHVGRKLADIAAARPAPIPFFGELGSVNPTFVLPGAIAADATGLAAGLALSVSGSAGQLCTKPGFVFVPAGAEWDDAVRDAFAGAAEHRLLTPSISSAYRDALATSRTDSGVAVVVDGSERQDGEHIWATPSVLRTSVAHLAAHPELAEETFGPTTVLVEYQQPADALEVAGSLFPGNLTCTVHSSETDDATTVQDLLTWGAAHAGRVLFGGWPTGVAVTAAQQHGGPWPATTNDGGTAVGTAAIDRFLRAVAYQDVPERFLPAPLQDANPWKVPQSRDQDGPSTLWGTARVG